MPSTTGRIAVAISAVVATLITVALPVPAHAVTAPDWPAAGRVPVGCDPLVTMGPINGPQWSYGFTDSGYPTVTSAVLSSTTSRTTTLPPAGAIVTATIKRVEACSGGSQFSQYTLVNMATGAVLPRLATQSTPDPFAQTLTAPELFTPDQAGPYRFAAISNARRYDAFGLDQDYRLASSTPGTGQTFSIGAVTQTPNYLLRATTLSNALSAARLAKGRTVKATGQLKMATNAGYVAAAGAKVAVQTKVGAGLWVTRATLTTNASGVVSYSFVLSATTSVRFLHTKVLSGSFTNGVVSATRTVTRA